jgi:transposase
MIAKAPQNKIRPMPLTAADFRWEFESRGRDPAELFPLVLEQFEKLENRTRRLEGQNQRLRAENQRLRQRLAKYEPETPQDSPQVDPQAAADGQATRYSLEDHERLQSARGRRKKKKRSPGRRRSELKFDEAQEFEDIRPEGVPEDQQRLFRKRAVWRLRDRRAVLVGYRIFRARGVPEPPIPGVMPRCEYGIEIVVVLAFLVYIIGISLDKACSVLHFFCHLPLQKSQADSLLRQLAKHWGGEFDTLCKLLVHAAVVYMDESGWKVGTQSCSMWAFSSTVANIILFGCRKDAETLDQILPPDRFQGVGVSDNAGVYSNRFVAGQKCWAHLLRKAIRLAASYPQNDLYQRFLGELMAIYHSGQRAAADQRLGEQGRKRRVAELEGRLCELCNPHWHAPAENAPQHERQFYRLVNELLELVMAEELFTFVLRDDVEPTNMRTERQLRSPARDRDAGRTNQRATGARRRSVIVSVLESLRAVLPEFTFASVVDEVVKWSLEGISCFQRKLQDIKASLDTEVSLELDSS